MAMKTADESPSTKRWLPLEAHPDLMNQFVWGLGLPMDEAEFYDVYCFDDELLEMVPNHEHHGTTATAALRKMSEFVKKPGATMLNKPRGSF